MSEINDVFRQGSGNVIFYNSHFELTTTGLRVIGAPSKEQYLHAGRFLGMLYQVSTAGKTKIKPIKLSEPIEVPLSQFVNHKQHYSGNYVYVFKTGDGKVIYIGSSYSVNSRIMDHMNPNDVVFKFINENGLTDLMIELHPAQDRKSVLLLEEKMIKQNSPAINVVHNGRINKRRSNRKG